MSDDDEAQAMQTLMADWVNERRYDEAPVLLNRLQLEALEMGFRRGLAFERTRKGRRRPPRRKEAAS